VDLARTIAGSGTSRGVAHVQLWGLAWQLWCLLPREDRSDRLDALEAALAECLATHTDVPLSDQILGHGVRALVLWRRGEGSAALEEARAAEQVIARTEQISQYLLAAYASLLELYTGLWEAARGHPAEARDLARRTRRIGKVLGEYRRMYPIGQPRYWLYRGRFHWLSGARAWALQAWGRGLAAAQRLCMPYEQGLIHAEIGRCGGPDARPHLTQARELFERVQADADLKRWVTGSESPSRTEAHS
jgi:hypothetical protein